MITAAPFLTEEIPGIGGQLKMRPDDFKVEEIPLYNPSGEGTHTYIWIEKQKIATLPAIAAIARALGIRRKDIGFAGLKDARAITRQWLSIEHADIDAIKSLDFENIQILKIDRHVNKIKTGHLWGNRFDINIRNLKLSDCDIDEAFSRVRQVLDVLEKRGIPNYYGQQRFGKRDDGQVLGAAIISQDWEAFITELIGNARRVESVSIQRARNAFEVRDYDTAMRSWPPGFMAQLQALRYLRKNHDNDFEGAFNAIDHKYRRFCISSFQSAMFNKVLAKRVQDIDVLYRGDIARKHDNGACFMVFEPSVEQPRCTNFDISPTGPMFGYEMLWPTEEAAMIENEVLIEQGLSLDDFKIGYAKKVGQGTRRSLRFKANIIDVSTMNDSTGPYINLKFELPSGSYATTLAREVTKNRKESLGFFREF